MHGRVIHQRSKLRRRRLSLTALAVPVAVAMLIGFPLAASASIGVGIQAGPVRLGAVAQPGQTYDLPPVYVVDTGTEPETVRLAVARLSRGRGRTVPPSWIKVSGPPVRLDAHQSAKIPVQLVVPSDAKPGAYFSDIVVHGSAGLTAGQASLAVAAATKLQFTVGRRAASAGLFGGFPDALAWAAAVLVLIAVAVLVLRRSGLRIRIERGSASYGPRGNAPRGPDASDHGGGPDGVV
ncbi:MAG: hypothetical protein ABJB47_10725 [Actinomycetota bacterium]